ncbi:hypothetical protein Pla123a_29600 [Posidoniimonas polymericola]|uniref:Transposase IS30-like HTH domain-containing protein n=1 Tax=Posidoniimonas polymericola TaxID=2528002 RepID=A0A5C5YKS4_9BACT|nr:hypothetical protein [Posidoniimonas polymericola]TWT75451.1 hypothetical protein Pla123a_29600 [Posidoniimonas polymericola]
MGRPRVLDEGKQREVCALLTAGMTVGEAAAYVGCCEKTIRREQRRDEDFDERVRRARVAARLGPLQAVRNAAATHWRAAAWLVDRQDRQEERERRARRDRAKLTQQRADAKPTKPPQPWNLEQEIQQIASARPPAVKPTPHNRTLPPTSPRPEPGEPVSAATPPPALTKKRPSPVAAALSEMASQLAASANRQLDGQEKVESQRAAAPVRRTKPAAGGSAGTTIEPTVEPRGEGKNEPSEGSSGRSFVPSLRIFGQNAGDPKTLICPEPPALAGGAEPKPAACRAGRCSGG